MNHRGGREVYVIVLLLIAPYPKFDVILFQEPILQYIMLKKVENVKSILENDDSKASLLDSTKKSPLHAAAFNGTPEIAGIFYYNAFWG